MWQQLHAFLLASKQLGAASSWITKQRETCMMLCNLWLHHMQSSVPWMLLWLIKAKMSDATLSPRTSVRLIHLEAQGCICGECHWACVNLCLGTNLQWWCSTFIHNVQPCQRITNMKLDQQEALSSLCKASHMVKVCDDQIWSKTASSFECLACANATLPHCFHDFEDVFHLSSKPVSNLTKQSNQMIMKIASNFKQKKRGRNLHVSSIANMEHMWCLWHAPLFEELFWWLDKNLLKQLSIFLEVVTKHQIIISSSGFQLRDRAG